MSGTSIDKIQSAQIATLYGIINSGAIPVYPPANDIVTITGNQTITGDKVFTGTVNAPTVDVLDDSTSVATTEWVKDYVPTITGGFVTASGNNNFTGINSFVNPITPTITTFDGIDMSGNDIINGGTFTATSFVGDLSGNASSATNATNAVNATTATNIAGGLGGSIPYQSAVNTTALLPNGTSGQYLKSNGTTLAPSWDTLPVAPVVNDGTLQINNGTHITGSGTFTANQSANTTITIATDATSSNTASTLVSRDASGDFSAGTITATTFIGDLSGNVSITNDNTSSTFYPVFVSNNTGNLPLKVDKSTTPLSYVPSTGTLTTQVFAGALNGAINASAVNPATTTTTYPCIFTATTGGFPLTGNGLTYIPSTNALTATTFVGDLSGNAVSATKSTNLAGGLGGQIPYQSAVNTTSLLANGTAGQVLTSNGTTLAPSWTTPATNASTINITDTTTTAGTYYPTFVSSAGNTQTLRADTQYLQYNPSTNTLQNPTFLVSDGTDTATQGGLNIKTVGSSPTNKQISLYSNTNTIDRYLQFEVKNSITNTAINQTFYTGSNTNSARYSLFAYNPSLFAFSQLDLNNTIGDLTCNSPNGDGTQEVGFQVDCSNNWATMYYNPDTTGSAFVNALRVDTNDLRYGTILASQGQAGVLPPLTNYYFKVDTLGVSLKTTLETATISSTLSLNFQGYSFKNFYNSTSITSAITISAISFSNPIAGGSYMVYITTGVGGSVVFNTGISGVKTTFSSNFTIPASSVAIMNIYYINSVYIVGINILT